MPGINGDLAAITVHTTTTPVHYTTSNVPLEELRDNQILIDQKLEGWIESGQVAESQAGDGTFVTPVAFNTPQNNVPNITTGIGDLTGTGADTIFVSTANRTTTGFDLVVTGSLTAAAWTANVQWLADGR